MSAPPELAIRRLPNLPISFFAMVMGLTGLTIAWEKAQRIFAVDLQINLWLASASAAVFVVLLISSTSKLVLYGQAVLEELRHPVKLNFFPTISISLLLFTQVARFAKLEFFLSWWAYSFPLAAISIASMLMYELSGVDAYRWIGAGLLLLLTLLVALLLVRTGVAVAKHRICVPGH